MRSRIKELRARYDLTQDDLARKVGVRRETILYLEKGKYNPSEVKGYAIGQLIRRTIYITDVEVKKPYRLQGYGRLLIKHLIKNSKANVVYVRGILPEARAFWRKMRIEQYAK